MAAQFQALGTLELLEPVSHPGSPIIPRTNRNVTAAIAIGIIVAIALSFLLENLTDTVRFPEQIQSRFGVTALGTVFKWNSSEVESSDLVLWSAPSSNYAEALRQIRANLQFASVNKPANKIIAAMK